MKTSLHRDLARGGWHSSVMTTYSVDPAFYDSFIERRLRRAGCENNILLTDAAMLTRALVSTPESFRFAGRKYAIVPVSIAGSFHPKIHLRLGHDKARLIVGSANATAAGWCRNLEVLADIDWDRRKQVEPYGALIRRVYEYLMHWLRAGSIDVIEYKCRMIERASPWLRDLPTSEEDIELSDGSSVNVFCDRGGDSPSMLRQFVDRVGEKPKNLIVVSPYWDAQLRGLRELQRVLPGCDTHVVLDVERNAFPLDALSPKDEVKFVALSTRGTANRFPHAKIILVETRHFDHVLFGSANCSDDALGLRSGRSRNAEASVYRRLPAGAVRQALELDLTKKLPRKRIRASSAVPPSLPDEGNAFNPGFIELSGQILNWYPRPGIDTKGARIQLGAVGATVQMSAGGLFAELASQPAGVLVARVTLRTGETSRPVVVHDERALRRAAPGQIDARLRRTFDRIRRGEDDILALAEVAHIVFALDRPRDTRNRVGVQGAREATHDRTAVVYQTAEEFRNAVALEPATGASGRFSTDNPELLQVLALVMRGVGSVGANEESETREREQDVDLEAADSEDEEMGAQDDAIDADRQASTKPRMKIEWFTAEQINRRRSRLKSAMDAFQEMLQKLLKEPSLVTSRIAIQTAFIIQLMLFACTRPHKREDGSEVTLMAFYPMHESEREHSFALRVARMLKTIWIGKESIAKQIVLGADIRSLPDDVVAWIVLSRWAIARASLAVKGLQGRLPGSVLDVARGVYVATQALGPLALAAEAQAMRELDAQIGLAVADTEQLQAWITDFTALASGSRTQEGLVLTGSC